MYMLSFASTQWHDFDWFIKKHVTFGTGMLLVAAQHHPSCHIVNREEGRRGQEKT